MFENAIILPQGMEKLDNERRAHVELLATELKRENFENDEAFREALAEQYRALRTNEYETEVRRQTLEMYTASRERKNSINHDIWVGSLDREAPADSYAVTAHARFPRMNPNGGKIASCAKTAVSVVGQVSDNLGYAGDENIATPTDKKASLASAYGVHDGLGNKEYRKTGVLKDLIAEGEIGSGSIVSVPVGNNGGSGYHAMVLADVLRDEKDNVVGYYLQGNNKTSYKYYDINDNGWNKSKVVCTATNVWMDGKISNEIDGKSPEELQAMITATKDRMLAPDGRLDKLATVEKDMTLFRGRSELQFEVNSENEATRLQRKNFRLFNEAHPIPTIKADLSAFLEVPQIDDTLVPTSNFEPDELMGAKAPEAKKQEAKAAQVETNAPPAYYAEPTAEKVETNAPPAYYAPTDREVVADMFMRIDEQGWEKLTGAYMDNYDKNASVADAMRGDAARTAAADGNTPSLVEGLNAEAPTNTGERATLTSALSDDKTSADGLFGSLLTALTTNDDKDLDSSMKLALNLLTSFLDGANNEKKDDMPTLADFIKYLQEDEEKAPALEQEKPQTKVALNAPRSVPLAMTTFSRDGR